jgi:hypothetical protein
MPTVTRLTSRTLHRIVWGIVLLLLASPVSTFAQSEPDVPDSEQISISAKLQTSPFPLPEVSDEVYAVGSGSGLDTGCTFRSGGPLEIRLPIGRYVGEVDANGNLTSDAISNLVDRGLLPRTLTLTMPAFDIDFNANVSSFEPERDRVFFNGERVDQLAPGNNEYLTGENGIWVLNSFQIPIEKVRFPAEGQVDNAPDNEIRIDIDVANVSRELWCMAVDWVAIKSLEAWRPVLLAHGVFSDGNAWSDWEGFLSDDGIGYDVITMDGILDIGFIQGLGSFKKNAQQIDAKVDEMKQRFGVDKIHIAAHSKGGLDTREYLRSNDDIEKLMMIGTPNAGSPIADLITTVSTIASPGFTGFLSLVTKGGLQLTKVHMLLYNSTYTPNPNTQHFTVAGNHSPGGLVDGAPYLPGENDTVVEVSSVHALPYADNQKYSASDGSAKHTKLTNTPAIYYDYTRPKLYPSIQGPSQTQQMSSPLLASLNSPTDVARSWRSSANASPSVSAKTLPAGWENTPTQTGLIATGEVQTHDVYVDPSLQATFQLIWGTGELDLTLVEPGGRRIDAATAASEPDVIVSDDAVNGFGYKTITVQNPVPGNWVAEVRGTNVTASSGVEGYGVRTILVDSGTSFTADTDLDFYRNGDPIQLTATFASANGQLPAGATVSAIVNLPDRTRLTVPLADDGLSGDGIAGDGVYGTTFTNTTQSGFYTFLVQGLVPGGPGSREELALATVSSSRSSFDGSFGDAGRDVNGDGLFDALDVNVGVDVTEAGTYRVSGRLTDASGTLIDATSSVVGLSAGAQTVTLVFSGTTIADRGIDGPYRIRNLSLLEVGPDNELVVDQIGDAYETAAYAASDFQRAALLLNGNNSDQVIDFEPDGFYDRLDVTLGVDVLNGSTYQWSARLVDVNGTEIDVDGRSGFLSTGSNSITLSFDGRKVGANGVDGPYFVRDLLLFSRFTAATLVQTDVAATRAYNFREFEGAPASCLPGSLTISDFDSDQPGEPDTGEFVAIQNTGSDPVSLTGCALVFFDGATSTSYFAADLRGVVESGASFVIGNPGVLGRDQTFPDDTMQNGPDAISLYEDAAASFPNGSPVVTDNLISAIVYVDDDTVYGSKSSGSASADVLKRLAEFKGAGELGFALEANFPNPFSRMTTIRFSVPEQTQVRLTVYDVLGREVSRLMDRSVKAGWHDVRWTPANLASGVYFVRIHAGSFTKTHPMQIVR